MKTENKQPTSPTPSRSVDEPVHKKKQRDPSIAYRFRLVEPDRTVLEVATTPPPQGWTKLAEIQTSTPEEGLIALAALAAEDISIRVQEIDPE